MSREEQQILLLSSRIKMLEKLLHEHEIPFPPNYSEFDNKSFDEIMSDVCSVYNKLNKNTKMYYIENTDTEYEIIEEEDEAPPPKPLPEINEDLLKTNHEKFDEIFKTLATIRTPKKLLGDYLKLKLETMKVMNIHTYIEMLLQLFSIFVNKKNTTRNVFKKSCR